MNPIENAKISDLKKKRGFQKQRDAAISDRDAAISDRDAAISDRDAAISEQQDLRIKLSDMFKGEADIDEFIASLSHDLRNPVATIKMAIELLRIEMGIHHEEPIDKFIELVERNADRASELIDLLLDAHIVRSGRLLPIQPERCDLVVLIKQCIGTLLSGNRTRVIFSHQGNGAIEGIWDSRALKRAIDNLLSNAVKYGDSDKKIHITIAQDSNETSIKMNNFGPAISMVDQKRIFERFFRAERDDFKSAVGLGLGLTLVKGVAEAHHGKMDLISTEAAGTSFILHLPNDSSTPSNIH